MLQKAMQFHMFLCAVSIVQASESEEKSCDKNLMAKKNTAVIEGRQSLEEETLQDQNPSFNDCIYSSFPDVAHVRIDPHHQDPPLGPPDIDPNWIANMTGWAATNHNYLNVTSEIECSDLMRRNTKAMAYIWMRNIWGVPYCSLRPKAWEKQWPSEYYYQTTCMGYKTFKSLCAAVNATPGVKSVSTPAGWKTFHYVNATDASRKTRQITEKKCADQLLEITEAAKVAQNTEALDQITHYEFRPQTKNGENNCFLGSLGTTLKYSVPVDFGRAKECLGRVA